MPKSKRKASSSTSRRVARKDSVRAIEKKEFVKRLKLEKKSGKK